MTYSPYDDPVDECYYCGGYHYYKDCPANKHKYHIEEECDSIIELLEGEEEYGYFQFKDKC